MTIDVRKVLPDEITVDNLEQAISTLREAVEKALADGKPVVLI